MATEREIAAWWYQNRMRKRGGAEKLDNLLLLVGGQSNSGTDPATGQTPYSDMPTYLQTAPSNVDFINVVSSAYVRQSWTVDPANGWGWLNQLLYVLSAKWTNILYAKRAVGGTDIRSGGGGLYPRADFKSKANYAIAEADTMWGAGNYNILMLWNLGETNGTTLAGAQDFEAALTEWFAEVRSDVQDVTIIFNKIGDYQVEDSPYIISDIQPAQDAVAALSSKNILVEGDAIAKWEIGDITDDFSHYNAGGAISLGNNFADKVLNYYGTSRSETTAPSILSIVVDNAAPSDIVITFDENINDGVLPFYADFSLSSGRMVTDVAISGATLTLTVSEQYYASDTDTLTYTINTYYEGKLGDKLGNHVAAFSQSITNNSLATAPTETLIYASDFSVDIDGWLVISGGTVARVDGIGGQNDVLECGSTDNTPNYYRGYMMSNTANVKHKVTFDIYIPSDYGPASANYSISIQSNSGELLVGDIYKYIRKNVRGGEWVSLEFTFTKVGTSGALKFAGTGIEIGDKFYLKNIKTYSLI